LLERKQPGHSWLWNAAAAEGTERLGEQPAKNLEPGPSVRYRYADTGLPSPARFLSSKT
jgi:hypothetical protein